MGEKSIRVMTDLGVGKQVVTDLGAKEKDVGLTIYPNLGESKV